MFLLSFSLSLSLSLLLIGSSIKLNGQNISGPDPVCPLNIYYYQIDNIPSNWTVKQIDWINNSAFLGTVAPVWQPEVHNGLTNGKLKVKWDGTAAPASQAEIRVDINYDYPTKDSDGNDITGNKTEVIILKVKLKGIYSSVGFKSPITTIQKCCLEEIEYELEDVGDADTYIWTNNTGFSIVSGGTNTSKKIKLKPTNDTGGKLKCRLSMSCSQASYYKEVEIDIVRHNAQVSFVPDNSDNSAKNQTVGICPGRNYTYRIDPVCGATSYTWYFPQSWQVNNGQIGGPPPPVHTFYIGASNQNEVTINTSQNPTNGAISVTANFNGCASVTSNVANATTLTAPPSSIEYVNELYEYFHCNQWKMCSSGGQIPLTNASSNLTTQAIGVDYFTFNIDPPRYFTSPQGSVQTKMVYRGDADFGKTPIIQGSGAPTDLSVTATNCIGTSNSYSITIFDELPDWCPGSPFWQPYPLGCECCEPGGDPNPKKTNYKQPEQIFTPNPASSYIVINLETAAPATVGIYSTDGRLIEQFVVTNMVTEHQLNGNYQSGLYFVHIEQLEHVFIQKLNIIK